ncbi:MAG: ribosomal protein S18-alanine N-acetyltransferase [Microcystaceae cyanobacterium]
MTLVFGVRAALQTDLPVLVKLDQLCLGGMWTEQGYQSELDNPHSHLSVLTKDLAQTQVIGGGAFWSVLEEAHITLLMVAPDYRGRGLGSLLLAELLKQAIALNLERATLEVKASNQTAIALYQKYGFKVAGTRKNYYQKTGEDALILWQNGLNLFQIKRFK